MLDYTRNTIMRTTSKIFELLSIVVLYGLPVVISATGMFPKSMAYTVGGLFASIIIINMVISNRYRQLKLIGSWKDSIHYNTIFAAVILIIMYAVTQIDALQIIQNPNGGITGPALIPLYLFLVVPLQQIIFFGDLTSRLTNLTSAPSFKIAINVSLYALIHLYYPEPWFILISTSILGSVWYRISQTTESIVGNILSHGLIGAIALYLQIV